MVQNNDIQIHPSDATTRMARVFCVPAVFFIFAAFVLLSIVSISLPHLFAMDVTRVHTSSSSTTTLSGNDTITELRVSFAVLFLFAVLILCLYRVVVWYMVCTSRPGAFSYGALIPPPGPIASTSQMETGSAAALVQSQRCLLSLI